MTYPHRYWLASCLGATLVGAVCWYASPARFYPSYLIAWLFFLGIALGAMVNVMIHELTGGSWGFALRRPLEAAMATLPSLALLATPLVFGLAELYPWAGPDAAAFADKSWYLNMSFFAVRAIACFATWIALALTLRHLRAGGETNATATAARPRAAAIAGLVIYALTVTIAAVDWIMSLSPRWYSTTFGLLVMVGQALAAFAFAIVCAAARSTLVRGTRDAAQTTGDLGNIVLMYAMLWAYLAFTQFLVIWSEDLPHEIAWYVLRSRADWRTLAIVVLTLQFAVPVVAMLFRAVKRQPAALAALCTLMLVAHVLELVWLVAPSFRTQSSWLDWYDIVALAIVGSLWLAAFSLSYARTADWRFAAATSTSRTGLDHG